MDLNGMKPLDLGDLVGKAKNRVVLVGVELEGAWKVLPPGILQLEPDGSVFGGRMPAGASALGELAIGPLPPKAIPELIKVNQPHYTNQTCGMHVHMSFSTLWYYHLLMVPEYQVTLLHYLTQWAKEQKFADTHHIWDRLAGRSRYCRNEFYPDIQAGTKRKDHVMDRPGHRYTAIHYCGRQQTIECRVLPMMKRTSQAIAAVDEVIKITNACLYVFGKKANRNKAQVKVELPDNLVYEETIIERF